MSGRLPVPIITLPLLPLSNNASTDSCSILFSFLTIISGAFKSINLLNLLFLLITLLYKSFKSDVANLPPSNGTRGLSSGGITGMHVKIIHSGLFPELINDSISFNLLMDFSSATFDLISFNCDFNFSLSALRSNFNNISLMASAPILASNESVPYSSCAFIYSSSVRS